MPDMEFKKDENGVCDHDMWKLTFVEGDGVEH